MDTSELTQLFDTARFGAYAMTLDQTIVYWNQSAERILGYKQEQVLGQRCFEVVSGLIPGGLMPECLHGCPSVRALRSGQIPRMVSMSVVHASGERSAVSMLPIVVAGSEVAAPLLVHLFDDAPELGTTDQTLDSVRSDLVKQGVDVVSQQPSASEDPPATARLTPRETEVLRLVTLGWSTQRIADELNISLHTVRNHVRHFRRKLNAKTKLDAVVTAMRLGIL